MGEERRKFERHSVPGDAYAVDEKGRELGKVVVAGGGGMGLELAAGVAAKDFAPGSKLRVTVVEPSSHTSHTLDATVCYCAGKSVGLEFAAGKNPFSQ